MTLLDDDLSAPDAQGNHCKFAEGRGIHTRTPVLPSAACPGVFRDIPVDSLEACLKVTDIQWRAGAAPVFRWEFWEYPDRAYNYGPSYLSGVIVQV